MQPQTQEMPRRPAAAPMVTRDRDIIDAQVATAHAYPRVVAHCAAEALELATASEEMASLMIYVLPRGGKQLEGPSVRLAEVIANSWGNIRLSCDVVEVTRTHVVAEGTCHDLQKNTAARVVVTRSITGKSGRYSDDMIGVTSNAAMSIALRNAVFKVIPFAFVKPIYDACRDVAMGDAGKLRQNWQAAIAWWGKQGVTEAQLLDLVGLDAPEQLEGEHLFTIRGYASSLKNGETTVDRLLSGNTADDEQPSEGTSKLNAAVGAESSKKKGAKKGKRQEATEPEAPLVLLDVLRLVDKTTNTASLTSAHRRGEHLKGEDMLLLDAFVDRQANVIDGAEDPLEGLEDQARAAKAVRLLEGAEA